MNYNQLSDEEEAKYEDMAKEPFHQMFHRLVQATDKGKCMLCKFSSGRKVLSFNKRLEWDGEYLAHIRQTHGLQPDDFSCNYSRSSIKSMIHIAETVTAYHPDKTCDRISDAILDKCLEQDPYSRVAVETMGGHGKIFLTGEVTTKAVIDYAKVARDVYDKDIEVLSHIATQSPEIAQGVNTGGAGDQGVMVGYACDENEMYIPNELYLARKILEPFKVDGKSQVTLIDGWMDNIVLSVQGETSESLHNYIQDKYPGVKAYCNNTGSFDIGGFDADAGVTGRKIVVDAYGPRVPVGGGAFSGKDPTKVDRSGAYMARWVALQLLKQLEAHEVIVKIGYVIGSADPVMRTAIVDGKESYFGYDCRPEAIIERFDLRRPIYLQTATNGHFGIKSYPWEQL